jgi:hypothetical protein
MIAMLILTIPLKHGMKFCTAIYFPIDERRCFLAHVVSLHLSHYDVQVRGDLAACTAEEGERVKQEVLRRLRQEATKANWQLDFHHARERVFVACPCPDSMFGAGSHLKYRSGYYTIEAVKEFLQYPDLVARTSGAVLVDVRDGEVRESAYDDQVFEEGKLPLEWRKFEAVPELVAENCWKIPISSKVKEERP